jgi:predicted phage terminase large subunit-like protein
VLFPPWFLAQRKDQTILACSYAKDLAASFGRRCRNLIDAQWDILGYSLSEHSKAADEWETTNGGRYFCAGVGAGIAGHRCDLGFIDDPIGSQESADSDNEREKQWAWYWNDFWPRLKPHAAQIIIANRRHEDDLIGRLVAKEARKWTVIRLPMLAEEDNDALGRSIGDRLWPDWFTDEQVETAKQIPRLWACLYQQRPAPEEGDYFKREWLIGYEPQDLPHDLRVYASGDFAVSEEIGANKTCVGFGGLDEAGVLWILPEIYWKKAPPDQVVDAVIDKCLEQKVLTFWAEKGHISKSLKPYMRIRMHERGQYVTIDEVTPAKGKDVRARSIQARMSQGMVRFPKFAPWWGDAEHELLTAFNAAEDDFVDMLSHLGRGIDKMVRPVIPNILPDYDPEHPTPFRPTMRWMRDMIRQKDRQNRRISMDM